MGDVFSAQGAGREKSPLAPFVVGDSRSLTSYAADQPQLADLFASGFCLSTLTSLISSRDWRLKLRLSEPTQLLSYFLLCHVTSVIYCGHSVARGDNDISVFSAIDDYTRVVPAVEFRNVEFAYDDQTILNDISFRLMRGELLVVLSASGGGKSTILKLALGLLKPDAGRILIDGEDITDHDEEALNRVRKRIGVGFQEGALFDSLSVYDNVAYKCHENGVPEAIVEQEVRRLLKFVQLEDAIQMMPAQLSGGMRVRVGIARALAGKPRTLLMDEPTGGLDPPTAWSVCELGIKLRDLRDVSAVVVTHGIEYVRFMASTYAGYGPDGEVVLTEEKDRLCLINTKIMMLRDGRIIFNGSDEELFRSDDTYIRNFLLL